MTSTHQIRACGYTARICQHGAELVSLQQDDLGEILWHAGPEWRRHAPILFPIVGRLTDDQLIYEGNVYWMTQHGFARDCPFSWLRRTEEEAVLELTASEITRAIFPFGFRLEVRYAVTDRGLSIEATVENDAPDELPFSIGAHPAFRWPLVAGVEKSAHRLVFDQPEHASALLIRGGLVADSQTLALIDRRILDLTADMFRDDVLILPAINSQSLRYEALIVDRVAGSLTVAWSGYKDLGLWSSPSGADFLCIEPWAGMSSPAGWSGEFKDKPGIMLLAKHESRTFIWQVSANAASGEERA